MRHISCELLRSEKGSVAPTVGLSLFALIAAGGIAFDYARLATMDTELQNAADHAALAAASQLDKKTNACARANAAIQSLVSNRTLFANDGNASNIAITVPSEPTCDATGQVRFYQDKAKTLVATTDALAKFVEVQVNSRQARYALTPIVGAISSGSINGIAFAGMGSAICKVPPLMMCNPSPGTPFDPDAWRGKGLKLFMGGGNSWAAGAFGWLDVGAVNNGTPDQRIAIAFDNPPTNCVADASTDVDTGVSASVLDALNTRFDIYQNGWGRNTCLPHANCSAAWNSTKDLVRRTMPSSNSCGISNNNSEWHLPAAGDEYTAQNTAGDDSTIVHMGYPMDVCHYPLGGSCGTVNQRFGNGTWRADLYFKTNHPTVSNATGSNWATATGLSSTASRYDMYRWEQNVSGIGNNTGSRPQVTNGGDTQYGSPQCKPPGLGPSPTQPDRRVTAAAVVDNCSSLSGGSRAANVGAWAEVFLVQPSVDRGAVTTANEIYVEIIGRANPTGSGATAQVVVRDVPYLIE
jgi:Flp pilus assembly protein TadG